MTWITPNNDLGGAARSRCPGRFPPASFAALGALLLFACGSGCLPESLVVFPVNGAETPWRRHTIDDSSRGADGVRLCDVNRDGRPDITTGWEEGGQVRVYLHPGVDRVKQRWPAVTVGKVRSPEDAVFVDLDGDGRIDVLSCCEGKTRTVYVHWAPSNPDEYLQSRGWRTSAVPATDHKQMWMFALPIPRQLKHKTVLVGAKGSGATIGLLSFGGQSRDVAQAVYLPLANVGWIMSIRDSDIDGDGDVDIIYSDRKGKQRGVWWLERTGSPGDHPSDWKRWLIGGRDYEVMFLDVADIDSDGALEIVTATRNGKILIHDRTSADAAWHESEIPNPGDNRWGKAVRVGDLNNDGAPDIVHTSNTQGNRTSPGVMWLEAVKSPTGVHWKEHDISGPRGVKFDRIELLDIDEDGDLDVLTCEERDNLGVIWYENPTQARVNSSE